MSPAIPVNIYMNGSRACAVCGDLMSQVDFDRLDAVATFTGDGTIMAIAHKSHFFNGQSQAVDYERSMELMAQKIAEFIRTVREGDGHESR